MEGSSNKRRACIMSLRTMTTACLCLVVWLPASYGALLAGPVDSFYEVGTNVRVPCQAMDSGGIGVTIYTWTYNNSLALPTWFSACSPPSNGDHCISLAQTSYTGYFGCRAESQGAVLGQERGLIQFIEPVIFATKPSDLTVHIGQTATFSCSVNTQVGSAATVSWWFRPLSFTPEPVTLGISVTMAANGDLTFSNVQEYQVGLYYCTATSPASRENVTARLLIFGADKPILNSPTKTVMQSAGSTLTVNCVTTGVPRAVIVTWYKDSAGCSCVTQVLGSPPRINILRNNSLQITTLQQDDEGKYFCQARNTLGTSVSAKTTLELTGTSGTGNGNGGGTGGDSSGITSTEETIIIASCCAGGGLILMIIIAYFLLRKPVHSGEVRRTGMRALDTEATSVSFNMGVRGSMKEGSATMLSRKSHRSSLEERMSRNFSDKALLIIPDGDIADVTRLPDS